MGHWLDLARSTFKRASANQVPVFAAAVAFRIFLSLVPSLVAAVAIFSLVLDPAELQRLIADLRGVVPGDALQFIEDQLQKTTESAATGGVAIVAVLTSLYAAVGGASSLVVGLNATWGLKETRNFFLHKLIALAITVALLVALVAVFVALVLGPTLVIALLPDAMERGPTPFLIGLGRYVAAVVVLIAFFAFVFWVGPNRENTKWRWITPGAIVAVVGWLLLSFGFSVYASNFGSYTATYGIFAGIILLLVWLQLSFTVLLMGAELDVELEDRGRIAEEGIGEPPTAIPPGGIVLPDVPQPAVPEAVVAAPHRFPSRQLVAAAVGATSLAVVAWRVRRHSDA